MQAVAGAIRFENLSAPIDATARGPRSVVIARSIFVRFLHNLGVTTDATRARLDHTAVRSAIPVFAAAPLRCKRRAASPGIEDQFTSY